MSSWLERGDFADVAEFLLQSPEAVPEDPALWSAALDARSRSAVSRAYYAVFLALKDTLTHSSPATRFPTVDAHRIVREALEESLGTSSPLVAAFRTLLRDRKRADYDLEAHISISDALNAVAASADAIELIVDLRQNQLSEIWRAILSPARSRRGIH